MRLYQILISSAILFSFLAVCMVSPHVVQQIRVVFPAYKFEKVHPHAQSFPGTKDILDDRTLMKQSVNMTNLIKLLLNGYVILFAALSFLFYLISLAIYRLFFHPLAQFPGPKLAAITRYYEAYYDVWKNGRYIFKIGEMHQKYGTNYVRFLVFTYELLICFNSC